MTTTTAPRRDIIIPDEVLDANGSFAATESDAVGGQGVRLRLIDRVLIVLFLAAAVAVSVAVAVGVALVATVLVIAGLVVRFVSALFRRVGMR